MGNESTGSGAGRQERMNLKREATICHWSRRWHGRIRPWGTATLAAGFGAEGAVVVRCGRAGYAVRRGT